LRYVIPKPDLDAYLQIVREGDPDAVMTEGTFWIGSLTESGHTTSLYGKTQEEIEQRATEILVSRYFAAEGAKLDAAEMAEDRHQFVIS
jgi:hypothetical protein